MCVCVLKVFTHPVRTVCFANKIMIQFLCAIPNDTLTLITNKMLHMHHQSMFIFILRQSLRFVQRSFNELHCTAHSKNKNNIENKRKYTLFNFSWCIRNPVKLNSTALALIDSIYEFARVTDSNFIVVSMIARENTELFCFVLCEISTTSEIENGFA